MLLVSAGFVVLWWLNLIVRYATLVVLVCGFDSVLFGGLVYWWVWLL